MNVCAKTLLLVVASLATLPTNAQVTVVNANVNILGGTTVTCQQNFVNQALGNVSLSGTLDVRGDVTNNGSLVGSGATSLLRLTGATQQLVDGSSTIQLVDFQIDNAGNGAVLANTGATGAVRVSRDLILTSGRLFANDASPIVFTPTANNPTETNANHIVGTAIAEARTINGGAFPLFLNLSMDAGDDLGNVRLERRTGHGTGNTIGPAPTQGYAIINGNEGIDCYWTIIPSNTGTNLQRNATFSWLPVFDNGKDLTQMQLWRTLTFNTITSPWKDMFAPPIPMPARTHTMVINNIHNSWTFSDLTNPLPVEMLFFNVKRRGNDGLVSWATTQEINTDFFEVQRSFDNRNFQAIGKVQAQNKAAEYSFLDERITELGHSLLYYRLKQIDKDGKSTLTAVRSLQLEDFKEQILVFPTPFSNDLTISIQNPAEKNLTFRLTDELGREIFAFKENARFTEISLRAKVENLPAGAYILTALGLNEPKIFKLIKL
jgi:hypothetical protein